jgi:hypothetical protein
MQVGGFEMRFDGDLTNKYGDVSNKNAIPWGYNRDISFSIEQSIGRI